MAASSLGGSMGKVVTKGRTNKMKAMDEEQAQPSNIRLTSLEQIMYKMLTNMRYSMKLPFAMGLQWPLGPYRADFAIPQLRLAIECDGEAWHSNPDKKAKDQMRDAELSKYGWTTVRFGEASLKEQQDAVQKTIAALIFKLWKKALEMQEKGQKTAAACGPMTKQAMEAEVDDFAFADLLSLYKPDGDKDFWVVSSPLEVYPMEIASVIASWEGGETKDGQANP